MRKVYKFFFFPQIGTFFFIGVGEREIAQRHFAQWVRYHRAFQLYGLMQRPPRMWEMEVVVLIGDTGVGKTRWAWDKYPDLFSVPPTKQSGCYWDGYDGQDTVLIDEMYGSRFSHSFLLLLLDRYPMMVPVHGGQVVFSSQRIVITSNAHPEEWYDAEKFPFFEGPLYRRMTQGRSRICRVDPGPVLHTLAGCATPELIGPLNRT